MKRNLYFVTQNQHKVREVSHVINTIFSEHPDHSNHWNIKSLADLGFTEDINETAATLEGNALLKASHIHRLFGVDCFADDTGLEVEALGGMPGVVSARYAGTHRSFDDNIRKVLRELQGHTNRKARFRTVIALILEGKNYFFEGTINGKIINEKKGTDGFGYDPVFVAEGYERTFAELNLDEKNKVSHRAMAMRKLCNFLAVYSSPSR